MIQQTSLDAYANIKKQLRKSQLIVFYAIKELKSCTNAEIARNLGLPINHITPRTGELVTLGLLTRKERRLCKVTGNPSYILEIKS